MVRSPRRVVSTTIVPVDAWNELALRASTPALVACAIAGVVGLAALVALPMHWAFLPLSLPVIGDFGLVGFVTRAETAARTPAASETFRTLRTVANVAAVLGALATGVAALALVFGGSVGVMRV
jgi:hypothetical protein